ncbi:DUF1566 domain-containing protein [Bacteroides fragilis]|uniref:Lcl domain-containing protein n=1 Tax=Bacteroides TaxID=816 RepID=UPI002030EFCB|nr:DUF1566 domain-containing protein [Bacteroides fragilis]MCE8588950.1 DUF1566 domain-containing protein [Bacteroides fragilis]MCE8592980.1 DUF1566 domain-containing protein [Bacteroides fragilis]MCE8657609.1 DUF1566 domain-containing protein [Bacteroides fragilis]MCE8660314.1 DUF1566 domain-containing protein [Bacteroides fragilis]MCM0265287.1 DUF1566 domain-containing protein [Bacteroides fragilis]
MKINNRYISRLNGLVKFFWIIILLGACQNDDRYGMEQDGPVLVKLSVSAADAGTALGNGTETDAQITSIYILQFNADADSYGTLRYVAEGKKNAGGTYTATLLQSVNSNDNYKLVILANLPDYGFLYGLYGKSYAEVQQASLSTATDAPLVFDDTHPYPMFGVVNGGTSVQVQEGTAYSGNTELIRAVARVDIGIGTKKTNADGTVSWTNTGTGKQPFVMTEVQVWKAGRKYTYMPALANYHWTTATTNGITSNKIVIDSPSTASGTTTTKTYDTSYITNQTYCAEKIYLPETDLQWGSVYDGQHTNRLAIIVGGYYNNSPELSYYRVDFTNDNTGDKMNILRNHVYRFTISSVKAAGYATAELAYKSMPKNLGFEATLEPWKASAMGSVPSISGYYLIYQGFNGENVNWTYAAGSSQYIPQKKSYWGTNQKLPFDYNNFYVKEGNSFYAPNITGGQNGELYPTVADAFSFEGTYPNLMVSANDLVDDEGNESSQWKTGTALTALNLCRDMEEGGYDDWRLPRLSELAFIYVNQASLEKLRGFTPLSGSYWCGSEYLVPNATEEQRKKSDWAWAVDFTSATGYASWHPKTDKLKIRCVRQRANNE